MDVVQGSVGPEGSYSIKFEQGVAKLGAKYQGVQAGAEVIINVDAGMLLDALAQAIPGTFDDAVIQMAKLALKAL